MRIRHRNQFHFTEIMKENFTKFILKEGNRSFAPCLKLAENEYIVYRIYEKKRDGASWTKENDEKKRKKGMKHIS